MVFTIVKSILALAGIVSSLATAADLATNAGVQEGSYPFIWGILLLILYIPVIPNMIVLLAGDGPARLKVVLGLLHVICGPFMGAISTWLWLGHKTNNHLWRFQVDTSINFGVLPASMNLVLLVFMYSSEILPLPWTQNQVIISNLSNS